jgi:hypothetical protein
MTWGGYIVSHLIEKPPPLAGRSGSPSPSRQPDDRIEEPVEGLDAAQGWVRGLRGALAEDLRAHIRSVLGR